MFNYKIGILVSLSTCYFVYINSQGPGSGVGGSCFEPLDCGLWHFECVNGVCRCDDDHVPDRENKWCAVDILKPCGYHDPCFDPNAECVGVAIPKYGTCQCMEGYTLHEKKRVCSVVIGNNCTTSDDCIEGKCKLALPCIDKPPAACNYTQCFCNNPLQSDTNGTKCRPALHDDCSQFNECAREHASCKQVGNKKVCECDVNYKEASREVWKKNETFCLSKLDIRCKNITDCADSGANCTEINDTRKIEPQICNRVPYWPDPPVDPPIKYCVCGEGFVRIPEPNPNAILDESDCLKVATEEHDNCTHSIQCTTYSGFGSECVEGNCKCQKGYYFDVDFDRCVRSCLCKEEDDVREIVEVLKELAPTFERFAKNNNVDISGVLRKIKNLSH